MRRLGKILLLGIVSGVGVTIGSTVMATQKVEIERFSFVVIRRLTAPLSCPVPVAIPSIGFANKEE
jgi:hypothetical protein